MKKVCVIILLCLFLLGTTSIIYADSRQSSQDSLQNSSEESSRNSTEESSQQSSDNSTANSQDSSQESLKNSTEQSSEQSTRNSTDGTKQNAAVVAGTVLVLVLAGVAVYFTVKAISKKSAVQLSDEMALGEGPNLEVLAVAYGLTTGEVCEEYDKLVMNGYIPSVLESESQVRDALKILEAKLKERAKKENRVTLAEKIQNDPGKYEKLAQLCRQNGRLDVAFLR